MSGKLPIPSGVLLVSSVKKITLKPTYIWYLVWPIYRIIVLAILIHDGVKGMCCDMCGYNATMANSYIVLARFGSVAL